MSHSPITTVIISGSKARLARLGRHLGVAVTENRRDGSPQLVVPAPAGCAFTSACLLPDGRVSAILLPEGRAHFWASVADFCVTVRGWTPEKGAEIMAAESHHRCERIRAEMAVNRKIAA